MSFGTHLRELREKLGISQSVLAERAFTSVDSVQNWEQDRTRPRIEAIAGLAKALGTTADSLLAFKADKGEAKRPRGRPTSAKKPAGKKGKK
jgi:transcriptional regulator with XRE-family HTH domain